jgi:hypothetical protein
MTPIPVILPFGQFDPELVTIKAFAHEKEGVLPEVFVIPLSDLLAQAAASAVGNASNVGEATLVAGTIAVANTSVTASSLVLLSRRVIGGTPGFLSYTRSAGVGFTINSNQAADTSTVSYMVLN